jgi:hypothetical protein
VVKLFWSFMTSALYSLAMVLFIIIMASSVLGETVKPELKWGYYIQVTHTSAGPVWIHESWYHFINRTIEREAKEQGIPADIAKALLWTESEWMQFNKKGFPLRAGNDTGIGQLSDITIKEMGWDWYRVFHDPEYNIECSMKWLKIKYSRARRVLRSRELRREINLAYDIEGYSVTDLAVRMYNGMRNSQGHVDRFRNALKNKPWVKK